MKFAPSPHQGDICVGGLARHQAGTAAAKGSREAFAVILVSVCADDGPGSRHVRCREGLDWKGLGHDMILRPQSHSCHGRPHSHSCSRSVLIDVALRHQSVFELLPRIDEVDYAVLGCQRLTVDRNWLRDGRGAEEAAIKVPVGKER